MGDMLVPFRKETLDQRRFIRDEVRFDLLYTISCGECAVALQAEDGGAVALENKGLNMWLWIDEGRGSDYASAVVEGLAECLKDAKLPGVVSTPEIAGLFAEAYCRRSGASGKPSFDLMAYACPRVKEPYGVAGAIEKAGMEHRDFVADSMSGFIRDCFHTDTGRGEAMAAAESKIKSGNLFLWSVGGKTVCMAVISHRAPRYARIGYVYTPPEERKKGYASALVAAVSRMVSEEGLTPMLYADMKNPDSNKVYRSIGYMEAGAVREIDFHYANMTNQT